MTMDYYYNFESFDITQIISLYERKTLKELFPDHKIIKNKMGEFMELIWEETQFPSTLDLHLSKLTLLYNLKTVYFIGKHTERQLNKKGIKSLYDLKMNLKYKNSALELLRLIKNRQYDVLCKNRYIYDLDVAFCFNLEELLFIDIETLGLYDSPIVILGLGYYNNDKFEIHILFARNLEEEIAICEHFKSTILPQFKCFITYNGKSFDIPYIANRLLYFFDENPMISAEEIPYKRSNSRFHHIDLYHNCRRKFKGLYNRYTLTDMEQSLISLKRDNELPSNLVGFCYEKYLEEPERYIGLIKEVIDHNYWDLYSMPLILQKLLEKS
ncbi:MAG: hypothetical protein EAX89_08875 [Candidatus Lokiarchaeota archaeon]|nr:hypothetical protein [Candidatus Lokiarchaeota archaeon]